MAVEIDKVGLASSLSVDALNVLATLQPVGRGEPKPKVVLSAVGLARRLLVTDVSPAPQAPVVRKRP